ncbi:hypothetical protein [Streptomyces virginiae]|uniref:hypothetical protein n=1 Tax=Streptomyces virginiae TaxID=1961 RepID=UPI002DD9E0DE|nr:hypothetical protein [Streptomyces virginiae]WSC75606.1 hypothetical protein OHA56_04380 [Streptomyces virginiae]
MSRPTRPDWELTPLEGVGPLRFGMRLAEVVAALPELTALRRFQADPTSRETLGVEFASGPAEPAVHAYFVDGRLFCVAADAAHGPQITLWGRRLTGCVPADLERFLGHAHTCEVVDVSYGPRGNPGADGLGLVVRLQALPGLPDEATMYVGLTLVVVWTTAPAFIAAFGGARRARCHTTGRPVTPRVGFGWAKALAVVIVPPPCRSFASRCGTPGRRRP